MRGCNHVKIQQAVLECIYTTGTILSIVILCLDKQYVVRFGWVNFILGQPVKGDLADIIWNLLFVIYTCVYPWLNYLCKFVPAL